METTGDPPTRAAMTPPAELGDAVELFVAALVDRIEPDRRGAPPARLHQDLQPRGPAQRDDFPGRLHLAFQDLARRLHGDRHAARTAAGGDEAKAFGAPSGASGDLAGEGRVTLLPSEDF